jgi:hypothetical protein
MASGEKWGSLKCGDEEMRGLRSTTKLWAEGREQWKELR